MSTDRRTKKRAELLTRLARAGRANSDATVLFHASLSQLLGLNPTDYKAMSVLERLGPMTAGEMAAHTGLATASVTNLLDRLEEKGFIRRVDDPADRRRVLATPVGKKVDDARKLFRSTNASLSTLYDRYSERELAVIADFLQRNAERLRLETAKLHPREHIAARRGRIPSGMTHGDIST